MLIFCNHSKTEDSSETDQVVVGKQSLTNVSLQPMALTKYGTVGNSGEYELEISFRRPFQLYFKMAQMSKYFFLGQNTAFITGWILHLSLPKSQFSHTMF